MSKLTQPAGARRVRLAELDALTDQIEPLLKRLDTIWRGVDQYLRTVNAPAVTR